MLEWCRAIEDKLYSLGVLGVIPVLILGAILGLIRGVILGVILKIILRVIHNNFVFSIHSFLNIVLNLLASANMSSSS